MSSTFFKETRPLGMTLNYHNHASFTYLRWLVDCLVTNGYYRMSCHYSNALPFTEPSLCATFKILQILYPFKFAASRFFFTFDDVSQSRDPGNIVSFVFSGNNAFSSDTNGEVMAYYLNAEAGCFCK